MKKRDLTKRLHAAKWTLELAGSGHIKAYPPGSRQFFLLSYSPSDPRGDKNTLSRIKRAGYMV